MPSWLRGLPEDSRQYTAQADIVLGPPFTALETVRNAIANTAIKLAGQNCHWEQSGAFTGEISPAMLKDCGCDFVIIGHSERRHVLGEPDEVMAKKLKAAAEAKLRSILCVGETLSERQRRDLEHIVTTAARTRVEGVTQSCYRITRSCVRTGMGDRHRPQRDRRANQRCPSTDPAVFHPQLR